MEGNSFDFGQVLLFIHLNRFQRKRHGCSRSPPACAGGNLSNPEQVGCRRGGPLSGSPSYYDCLWVPCLLGCLNLCFNKCCCNAKTCDLVNDNVSDCCPNGLEVSDESEDNTKSGAMGQSTCSLYWPEMQSPL